MAQKKFINPLTDFGFKRVFGNKDILLAFLNDLFEGEIQFKDLTYSDKEIKGDSKNDKTIIYDIHCTTSEGKRVIVEMQNQEYTFFKDRMIYYTARDIAKQGEAGKDWNYKDLNAVYSIFFTNFELFKERKKRNRFLRHDIKLVDTTTSNIFSDKLHIVCLQVPLTIKNLSQKETKLDAWMYNLKNMETMQSLANTDDMPIFKRLEQVAEYHQLSPEDRLAYDISYKHWLDAYNVELYYKNIQTEHDKAMKAAEEAQARLEEAEAKAEAKAEEALAKAKEEAREEATNKVAVSMKRKGMDIDTIAEITGLTIEEIEKL